MAILYPLGIESEGNPSATVRALHKLFKNYLFVNPEKMTVNRSARLGEARTMGGTVFQPWPNAADEITFEGTMYGLRSLYDIMVLSDAINASPDYKEIKLVYKWKKFSGFIRNLNITSDANKPRQLSYTFTFVGRDAIDLYRMLLGQLTGAAVEKSFIQSQVKGVASAVKSNALNNVISIAVIGLTTTAKTMEQAAIRTLMLLAYGAVFHIGRGKGWRKL